MWETGAADMVHRPRRHKKKTNGNSQEKTKWQGGILLERIATLPIKSKTEARGTALPP